MSRVSTEIASAPSKWRGLFAVVPGIGVTSLLLGATCPACWLAYAGLLALPGLGVLLEYTDFVPVTAALLGVALASLAYRAPVRRGYAPLGLGIGASSSILVGKVWLSSDPLVFLGLVALIGASVWNAWPRHATSRDLCAACAPQVSGKEQMSAHEGIAP
jgi:mercuric ion transport protein